MEAGGFFRSEGTFARELLSRRLDLHGASLEQLQAYFVELGKSAETDCTDFVLGKAAAFEQL